MGSSTQQCMSPAAIQAGGAEVLRCCSCHPCTSAHIDQSCPVCSTSGSKQQGPYCSDHSSSFHVEQLTWIAKHAPHVVPCCLRSPTAQQEARVSAPTSSCSIQYSGTRPHQDCMRPWLQRSNTVSSRVVDICCAAREKPSPAHSRHCGHPQLPNCSNSHHLLHHVNPAREPCSALRQRCISAAAGNCGPVASRRSSGRAWHAERACWPCSSRTRQPWRLDSSSSSGR